MAAFVDPRPPDPVFVSALSFSLSALSPRASAHRSHLPAHGWAL
jgi:hypothetical protein